MMLFVAFFAAVSAAIVATTFLYTSAEYGTLPDRVPLQVGIDGTVNAYGPRVAIWFLPGVQLLSLGIFAFAGYAVATNMPGTHGSLRGLAVFAPCILAVVWRAQLLLISVAKANGNRVPLGGFWLFFAAMLAVGSISARFL